MTNKELKFKLITIDDGVRLYKASKPFKSLPPNNYRKLDEQREKEKTFLEFSKYLMMKGFMYLAIVDSNGLRLAYPVILKDSKRLNPQYILLSHRSIGGSRKPHEIMTYKAILKHVVDLNNPLNSMI